jgi:hypothetical protein
MKKIIIASVLFVGVATIITWSLWAGSSSPKPVTATPNTSVEMAKPPAAHNHATMARVPAYYKAAPSLSTLPPTLSPELFKGNERLAYQAAKEIPQTLAQLPCYCHCDRGFGHKSLLSCFETEHGENCGICIGEALMALNLEKRGKLNVVQIREQIITAYGSKTAAESK